MASYHPDENLPLAGLFVDQELKDLFNDSIDQLMVDLNVDVQLYFEPTASGCPNCGIAPDKTSNGKYNSSNAFLAGQFNRPFPVGGKCPVCQGSHKIFTEQTIKYHALVGRVGKDLEFRQTGIDPTNVVRTKTKRLSFNDVKRAKKALIEGEIFVRLRDPVRTGLAPAQFVKTYWKKQD